MLKVNAGIVTLRLLAFVPAAIAVIVLGFAGLFSMMGVREQEWILLVLSVILVLGSLILFHCSYLAWRRPSPATVREVCEWTGYVCIGIAFLAFERLRESGREWMAWSALIAGLLVVVAIEPWLTRFLARRVFRTDVLNKG